MQRIILRPKRDFTVRRHHPWVFSGAVASGEAGPGETVEVATAGGETLGYGSYSPASQIRVRMLSFDPRTVPDEPFVARLVARSVARRAALLAGGETTAVRLVNAENDGLPGVVADSYGGWVVCQFTSAGAEAMKSAVAAALLSSFPGCRGVAVRNDVDARRREGLAVEPAYESLAGDGLPAEVEIREGNVRFLVDVRTGHKTGFYLDQREARAAVGALARGADVLNCFAYTGGFGLACRAGGAASVTQVDLSAPALALARRNEALSFPGASAMEYVEADVFRHLRACRDAGRTFDLIVLDPPKFAESRGQVMKAARGYKDINLLAMKLLRPNGILATFSCSGAMAPDLFDKVLAEAAADAGRDFQAIGRTRQASDHPVALTFPEGLYLKGAILRSMS